MSNLCVIEGCPGSTRHKKRGEKIYFFKALEDQLEEWSRVIPGDRKLQIHERVCSRHFKDEDLIKEWNFVIEDRTVTMPRGRWTLKVGAVPVKFDNYEDDFRVSYQRKSKPDSLAELRGSSSNEEYEEPRRKRVKSEKKLAKVLQNPRNDSKLSKQISGKPSKENCGKSANQTGEVSWEKACDNFLDQLSSICAPAPSDKPDAKPAKRRLCTPRKDEERSSTGRHRKDKWRSSFISQNISSHNHTNRLKQKKSASEAISGRENENSVIVAPCCDDPVDVESLDDSWSQITMTECAMTSNLTVKTEKDDGGFENLNSSADNRSENCSVTCWSGDSASQQRQRVQGSVRDYEGVVVKREICDCEGDSGCCEPQRNCEQTVLELPDTPIPWEENNQPIDAHVGETNRGSILKFPEPEIDRNLPPEIEMPEVSVISIPPLVHELPISQLATSVSIELITKLESEVSAPANSQERRKMPDSQIEALDLATNIVTQAPTPNCKLGREELAPQRNASETHIEEIPEAPKNQILVQGSSDIETDFLGFTSEEEENVSRRKHYLNTAEMAAKSSKFYFSKLAKLDKFMPNTPVSESYLSPSRSARFKRERRTSAEIAMDQLEELDSMLPVQSKKKAMVKDSVCKTKKPAQDGKVLNKNNSLTQRLPPDSKCDEVLKRGRISDEVTVTKASNLNQRLDKVPSVSNVGQRLDKVTSSSSHVHVADKLNPKSNSLAQSSKGGLISNKPLSTNNDRPRDKVTTSVHHHSLKDKVTVSSKCDLLKNKGENLKLKEKIPITSSAPVADRLSHLLYGSSLNRIIESSKGTSLLDSVPSASTCEPSVDKPSQILKNFKTDGVLALECVVLKEQVRKLQKELYLHKEMLIDSEHNVALLRRKLELQAQLPCINCVNVKRGFVGKETLI